jgi:hypothetical protein
VFVGGNQQTPIFKERSQSLIILLPVSDLEGLVPT